MARQFESTGNEYPMALRVVHYTEEHVDNPNPEGEPATEDEEWLRVGEFFRVRDDLVVACRKFGLTGPEDHDLDNDNCQGLKYWVVDDIYSYELYQYMEIYHPDAFTEEWLTAVVEALRNHPGWGVGVPMENAYLLIFGDRLMVTGEPFETCHEPFEVMEAAARILNNPKGGGIESS